MNDLETLWANILSRDAVRVRAAWNDLDRDEQIAIHAHLTRMVTEDDWAEPQRVSAQAALDALGDPPQDQP